MPGCKTSPSAKAHKRSIRYQHSASVWSHAQICSLWPGYIITFSHLHSVRALTMRRSASTSKVVAGLHLHTSAVLHRPPATTAGPKSRQACKYGTQRLLWQKLFSNQRRCKAPATVSMQHSMHDCQGPQGCALASCGASYRATKSTHSSDLASNSALYEGVVAAIRHA